MPVTHWNELAQRWRWVGPPLRPCAEDVRAAEGAVRRWHEAAGGMPPDALLLGVTPEIATMRWPAGTRLVGVDHSWAMIRAVWPGAPLGFPAVCAEWYQLPLRDGSRDVVIGDGSFSALKSAHEYGPMAQAARRVMRREAVFVIRFFVRPDAPEPPAAVFEDLRRGRIGSFHVFKWRLVMSLQEDPGEGVALGRVWDAWRAAGPEPEQLARRTGWPLESVLTMEAYRGAATRYSFPTLAEARSAVAEAFEETGCVYPTYELGERCPTLIFRPR